MDEKSDPLDKYSMIKRFLYNLQNHPQTSAMGVAAIAGSVSAVIHDPKLLSSVEPWTGFFGGIALLMARDPVPKSQQ